MLKASSPGNQYVVDGVIPERREWTEEDAEFVKVRWFAGWSASQIAAEMLGRSRNAVISLVSRRQWDRTRNNTNQHDRIVEPAPPYKRGASAKPVPAKPPSKPTLHLPKEPKRTTQNGLHLGAKLDPVAVAKYETPSDGVGISLDQLDATTCRWPKGTPGEPDFVFCGCHTIAGKPYCAPHARRAYE